MWINKSNHSCELCRQRLTFGEALAGKLLELFGAASRCVIAAGAAILVQLK